MAESKLRDLSVDFAVKIIKLCEGIKGHYSLVNREPEMKTNRFQYVKLTPGDAYIPFLLEIHSLPEISRFIGIDKEKYFDYVTGTDYVDYFKVMLEDKLVAAVHTEKQKDILYLSIFVLPQYQNKGFGTQILEDVKAQRLVQGLSEIIVSVDKDNAPSIKLFEKAGFIMSCKDDNLLEYHWVV